MDVGFRIKENSVWAKLAARKLKAEQVAIVFGKTIHLHNTSGRSFLANRRWVKHEMAHIEQYNRYGFIKFLVLYVWYSIRYGYYNNPFKWRQGKKKRSPFKSSFQ